MIKIYTDGAYSPLRNKGGWAFIVVENDNIIHHQFFPEEDTTNNRMEITAVINALKWCIDNNINEVTIICDSLYVINTITKGWARKKNTDLWEKIDECLFNMELIEWEHVKGHSGNKYNELCDIMAVEASK